MAQEIERKFLVTNGQWRDQVRKQEYYRQGYLNDAMQCSIRVRVANDKAFLNIKSATLGIQRTEYEYAIPITDANEILDNFSLGPIIEKTRYFVDIGKHTWEIDVFEGDNEGLVVAEIELADEHESFDKPDWVGEEVSDDPRYYNVCLVKHPYKDW
jgi:adenylate cyclase